MLLLWLSAFTPADGDGDGTPDASDLCWGADDALDTDLDEIPDGCEPSVFGPPALLGNVSGPTVLHAADLDGDGRSDVFVGAASLSYLPSLGGGAFGPEVFIAPEIEPLRCAALADIDGDGDTDAVHGRFGVFLHENLGQGVFAPPVDLAPETSASHLEPADLDGDGDLDLALASGTEVGIAWLRHDGPAWALQILDPPLAAAAEVWPADLDADGDLDLLGSIAVNLRLYTVAFYENMGQGVFAEGQPVQELSEFGGNSVVAQDLDNDGLLDAVIEVNQDVIWLRNEGQGDFGPPELLVPALYGNTQVLPADLDLDGKGDLLVGRTTNNDLLWLQNVGATWVGHPVATLVDVPTTFATLDADDDGDLDIALGNGGQGEVYLVRNLGRDVDGDGVPDSDDPCPLGDSDGDGLCDDQDPCPDGDQLFDEDADGIADGCDLCAGADASGDADLDGYCALDGAGDVYDCDEADPEVHPDAVERCNGRDDRCAGSLPEDEADQDGDGSASCEGDCDDADPAVLACEEPSASKEGCGCQTPPAPSAAWLLVLLGLHRRRRAP